VSIKQPSNRRFAASRIATLAHELLDASTLCAIATVTQRAGAHVNTAYFAWSPEFDIVWLSDPGARHSQNLRVKPTAAIAVCDSGQTWGKPDRGIQLFGAAKQVVARGAEEAERIYASRFAGYGHVDFGDYRFYRFRPRRLKLFDERGIGAGVFVTAQVGAGGKLSWERTEVYGSHSRR
jgi:uncharacterized protein YhbP (UPF0306 family)